jgi:hypothetical protein
MMLRDASALCADGKSLHSLHAATAAVVVQSGESAQKIARSKKN